jgi:hypothetical protein
MTESASGSGFVCWLSQLKRRELDMKQKMIRYSVKPEKATENEALIAQVFDQLHLETPPGFGYSVFKLADGVSFVHIVSFETEDEGKALGDLAAHRVFRKGIGDRCESQPVTVELEEIGSYTSFSELGPVTHESE